MILLKCLDVGSTNDLLSGEANKERNKDQKPTNTISSEKLLMKTSDEQMMEKKTS